MKYTLTLTAALIVSWCAAAQTQHMVAMSDGTQLLTVVYLPSAGGPAWPVVLERTPYPRAGSASRWTNQGMAYVEQSVRGRFGSQGAYHPFADDGWGDIRDGADTVAWIRAQSWCNGKVGTFGGSAQGITSSLLAGAADLQMQIIQDAGADFLDHLSYQGGVFRKSLVEGWMTFGVQTPAYPAVWKAQSPAAAYWDTYDAVERASLINAPGVHVGGWWDIFARGTVNFFMARQYAGGPGAKGNQKLVMRPTAHGPWVGNEAIGFPPNFDAFQVTPYRNRFAQYWLNGADNGIMDEPAVHYYTVGDATNFNGPGWEWRTAVHWPPFPPNFETAYYLDGAGGLVEHLDEAMSTSITYAFDPGNPVPTTGGQNLVIAYGPHNQAALAARDDVVVFETAPMLEPLEATGPFRLVLHVSSDAPDTDFTAKLVDIYPDGRHVLMLDNIQRVRYRNGNTAPAPPLTGEDIVQVEIDLGHISWIFNTGHRIGIHISSSNSPRFEVNPNNGDEFPGLNPAVIAQNTVWTGSAYPSALYIPKRQPTLDSDGDGLTDEMEWDLGTDIFNADSDGDGLSDADEVLIYGTDPLNPDTDGNGVSDYIEILAGTDPLDPNSTPPMVGGDANYDGLTNAVDVQLVINKALGADIPWPCDLNCDGDVDALDVQLAINAALGIPVAYC